MLDNERLNKLQDIMMFSSREETVKYINGAGVQVLPVSEVIDIEVAGGLEHYAVNLDANTERDLYDKINVICRKIINDEALKNKDYALKYTVLHCISNGIKKMKTNGRLESYINGISETAFNSVIAERNLWRQCDNMWSKKEDIKFADISLRVADVWNLSDKDIDALRYFVCQCKSKGTYNPSLNKCIYIWGEKKQTGKTTFAKALSAALNGDVLENAGKYISSYATECQYNDHDLPKCSLYNCVMLDEAFPKDTRKNYNKFKEIITSNSATYNPKFRRPYTVKARRNYIFTSNENVSEYIQDDEERRIYSIQFKDKPKQIDFESISALLRSFVISCEPRGDVSLQEWYNSFDNIQGVGILEQQDIIDIIKDNYMSIFQENCKISIPSIAQRIFKCEPSREQKNLLRKVMRYNFSDAMYESNNSVFRCNTVRNIVESMNRQMVSSGNAPSTEQQTDDLPF